MMEIDGIQWVNGQGEKKTNKKCSKLIECYQIKGGNTSGINIIQTLNKKKEKKSYKQKKKYIIVCMNFSHHIQVLNSLQKNRKEGII